MKTRNSDVQTKLTLAAAMVIFGTIGLLRRLIDVPSAAIAGLGRAVAEALAAASVRRNDRLQLDAAV